jgi:hypothetical protein
LIASRNAPSKLNHPANEANQMRRGILASAIGARAFRDCRMRVRNLARPWQVSNRTSGDTKQVV